MKKRTLLVFAVIIVIAFALFAVGCQSTDDPPADQTTPTEHPTENPTGTPPATPTPIPSTVIESDARPVIVKTAYETEDTVIADYVVTDSLYGADPTGEKDSASAIQKALKACGNAGGGTVFLPTGTYLVKSSISIPSGVVLRGDWQDPDSTDAPGYGTVILADITPIESSAAVSSGALFYLSGNSAAIGLTVYYPKQNAAEPKTYGYTFYCGKGSVDTVTLRCLTLINATRGIAVSADAANEWHELAEIEKIRMCALEKGFEMYHSSDVGYSVDIRISPAYWTNAYGEYACADPEAVVALCRKQAIGMLLGDLDLEMLTGISITGCQTGIRFINPHGKREGAFWGTIYDLTITDCDYGIDAVTINTGNSALFARGKVCGSVQAIRNNQQSTPLRLCGITVEGKTTGLIQYDDDTVTISGGIDGQPVVRGSYTKPNAILYTVPIKSLSGKKEDAAPKIQEILNKAGETGGVVYLPAGIYSLYSPLTVPAGVELAGVTDCMNRDTNSYRNGTLLLTYVQDTATVTLGENAGVTGLRIWAPSYDATIALEMIENNAAACEVPIIRGTGKGVYCTDTVLVAGFVGIDFRGCDNHFVKQVFGCCYLSLITVGGKNGYVEDCLANPNFNQRHNSLFSFFDTKYANLTRWKKHHDGEQQQKSQANYSAGFDLLCDSVLRGHCVPFTVENAENERLTNIFMYASYHLLSVKNSSVTALNTAIDTLKKQNAMFVAENSSLLVINALRIFGSSVQVDDTSRVYIFNRDDRNCIRERGYNTDISREDMGDNPSESITDILMLSACDELETGMSKVTVTDDSEWVQEGDGALYHTYNSGSPVIFDWKISVPIDISEYMDNGYIHLWIYLSDENGVLGEGQLELCSGGTCDKEEYGYSIMQFVKKTGWSELYIPLSSYTPTGDTFDPTRLNYIRIYSPSCTCDVVIDDFYVCK